MSPTPKQEVHGGIDVSKRTLDVCLLPQGESYTLANDQEGVEELLSRLQKVAPKLVVLEATGG
jgi:transposase